MAKITFNEYQGLAARTATKHDYELVNFAMGLDGESGELIDLVKKFLFHKHNVDKIKIKKEAGDVLWYASQLARILKIDFTDAFDMLNKLAEEFNNLEDKNEVIMVSCLTLSEAVGNISHYIDRKVFEKKRVKKSGLRRELSKVLVNLYFLITTAGLTIEEVAEGNIEKLKARYPEGFSSERSINRTED